MDVYSWILCPVLTFFICIKHLDDLLHYYQLIISHIVKGLIWHPIM